MAFESKDKDKSSNRLPMMLAVAAFSSAWVYSETESATLKQAIPVLFGLCLGLALVLWGIADFRDGTIRGRNRTIRRQEYPRTFLAMALVKRFLPGVVMMLAGLWFALTQVAG